MIIKISFKSKDPYYRKEKDGLKRNTIRLVLMRDPRYITLFNIYNNGPKGEYIEIVRPNNSRSKFKRKIRDVSIWEGFFIISW